MWWFTKLYPSIQRDTVLCTSFGNGAFNVEFCNGEFSNCFEYTTAVWFTLIVGSNGTYFDKGNYQNVESKIQHGTICSI